LIISANPSAPSIEAERRIRANNYLSPIPRIWSATLVSIGLSIHLASLMLLATAATKNFRESILDEWGIFRNSQYLPRKGILVRIAHPEKDRRSERAQETDDTSYPNMEKMVH
jgi:hypothetical protein